MDDPRQPDPPTTKEVAAEVERLRKETSSRVEARRLKIAQVVEAARVDAENNDREEREKLALGLEEAHNFEIAHATWRIDGHDKRFADLNGSVEKLAGAVEEQAGATVDLRQEIRDSFARQESAALRRELDAKKTAEEVEKKAKELTMAAKAESRKLLHQFGGSVVLALIGTLLALLGKVF